MLVFCTYHRENGHCTLEDYNDTKEGRNPSGMVRVVFDNFTQAVPLNTLEPAPPELDEADYWDGDGSEQGC